MLSFGDLLRRENHEGMDLQDFGMEFLDREGPDKMVDGLLGQRKLAGSESIIIDGVRHDRIWGAIQNRFPESQLLCMDTSTPELLRTLEAREHIDAAQAIRRLAHPVEQEFDVLMVKANFVVRQQEPAKLIESAVRELVAIIDAGIVPSSIRAKLKAPENPALKKEEAQKQLLEDIYSKGRRRVFDLLLAEGGCVDAEEFAQILGTSERDVSDMADRGFIFRVQRPTGESAYPVWQVSGGRILPGMDVVLAQLAEHNDIAKLRFFLNRNLFLGEVSPLSALREGHVESVIRASRIYLTQSLT